MNVVKEIKVGSLFHLNIASFLFSVHFKYLHIFIYYTYFETLNIRSLIITYCCKIWNYCQVLTTSELFLNQYRFVVF